MKKSTINIETEQYVEIVWPNSELIAGPEEVSFCNWQELDIPTTKAKLTEIIILPNAVARSLPSQESVTQARARVTVCFTTPTIILLIKTAQAVVAVPSRRYETAVPEYFVSWPSSSVFVRQE